MIKNIFRITVVAVFIPALLACAAKPATVSNKQVITKIAILPVADPLEFILENRSSVSILSPISALAFKADSKEKTKKFAAKIASQKTQFGKNLTAVLVEEFKRQGYQVVVLDGVTRSVEDPDDIDYKKIKTDADAILHVYFHDIALFSSTFSNDYLPRVNITGILYSTQRDTDLYDENLYYGVDARSGKSLEIVADPKFAYPSFESVIDRTPEIVAVFDNGAKVLRKRLAEVIKETTH